MTNIIPTQDWSELTTGSQVEVTAPGGASYAATIDVKTKDSTVVWLVDTSGQRRAFDYREGVELVLASDAGSF